MRDDIIAHALDPFGDFGVEIGGVPGGELAALVILHKRLDGVQHQMQRGRLQRLDKALRQPHRHHIARPVPFQLADVKAQVARGLTAIQLAQGGAQFGFGGIG